MSPTVKDSLQGLIYDRIQKMGKFINAFASFLGERVDILIMPRKGASTKFKLHRLTILVILLAWLCVTAGGILFFIRGYDYNVIKADNHLMHLKLQLIADELERGRKYIELTHTTDTQMRQMLGMPNSKFSLSSSDWEKKKTQQDERAQKLFSGNLKDLETDEFEQYVDDIEDSSKTRLASFQEIAWYFANQKEGLHSTPSIRPSNAPISSGYGYRLDPMGHRTSKKHNGVDFAGKPDSPIFVTADGVVRHAGWVPSFGQAILVDHGFGYSTLYAHTTGAQVKPGDTVKRGDKIATMGSSGRSTGTHLHYEVWKDGQPVNPRNYFK